MAFSDYSATPASNTAIAGISVAEGCPPGNVNNAIRQLMADARAFSDGIPANLVGETEPQTLLYKTMGSGTVLTADGTVSDTGSIGAASPGFRGTPVISATTRTLQLSDLGKTIYVTGNVTIPTGLPQGFVCQVYNNTGSTISIIAGSGITARKNGTATSATNATLGTVAQRGKCAIEFIVSTTEALCTGVS